MAARKGRQATRGGNGKSWPAWMWVGIGLLLGVGLMLLVLFKDWAPLLRKKNLPQPNPTATAPQASEPDVADTGKPKEPAKKSYDFYKVLEANEVVIPDAELSAKARAEQQAKAAPNATTTARRFRASTGDGGRPLHPAGRLVSGCEGCRRDQGETRAARFPGAGATGDRQRQGVASRAARTLSECKRARDCQAFVERQRHQCDCVEGNAADAAMTFVPRLCC